MDRILPGSKRRLADWPLAIKTILAFWAFYFVMTSTRAMLIDLPGQGEALRRRVGVMLVAATLTWLIYLLLKRFDRASIQVKIVAAATAALPASMLLATVNHYAFYVYSPLDAAWISEGMERRGGWSVFKIISESTHSWYFFFAAWAAIFIALSYARQLREADQRAAILVREAQEAQLRALRYQINPHFLFNTLNSLSALVLAQRNDAAERMLMNLSAFFRTTLAADPTADVPLAEEIKLQQLYLDIEQARFPDRLKVEIDVPDALLDCRVPVLILQPVIENSVKYGVARARRPVTIRVTAYEEAGRLHIKVRDDGDGGSSGQNLGQGMGQGFSQGFSDASGGGAASPDPESTGVGLRNVCDRLASRFGDGAGCIHGPDPEGGYLAHIFFPMPER